MSAPQEPANERRILDEQIAYYRARATEYDEWFLRTGRYDHGPDLNRQWFAEAAEVQQALAAFDPQGNVLELACGTGIWTEQLVHFASHITAVDASPEMLALNGERLQGHDIDYIQADIFTFQPIGLYDVVFFSFWLSHVPHERFAALWNMLSTCLLPGGRVFLVDSLYSETSTAQDHRLRGQGATTVTRRLNDGREFEIVKVFYRPAELAARLARLGWRADLQATANYFLYGSASPLARD